MRTIGLIGGMSWESTELYYRTINSTVSQRLGGLHSASILLASVDFAAIEALQRDGDWNGAGAQLAVEARRLQAAGAEAILLCTNTMHKVAPAIEAVLRVPFIHIADTTAAQLQSADFRCAGLLGTRFTMDEPFYRERLSARSGAEIIVPGTEDRAAVDRIIFTELCRGVVDDESRQRYVAIIEKLRSQGAEAVILGCTEIGMLVRPADTDVLLIDTMTVHANAAVEFALDG